MNNSVYDLSFNDWEEYLVNIGSKKFHAKQIFRWLYDKRVSSFDEMSDLSLSLRDKLTFAGKCCMLKVSKNKKERKVCLWTVIRIEVEI